MFGSPEGLADLFALLARERRDGRDRNRLPRLDDLGQNDLFVLAEDASQDPHSPDDDRHGPPPAVTADDPTREADSLELERRR
jgi:hypothetical protein